MTCSSWGRGKERPGDSNCTKHIEIWGKDAMVQELLYQHFKLKPRGFNDNSARKKTQLLNRRVLLDMWPSGLNVYKNIRMDKAESAVSVVVVGKWMVVSWVTPSVLQISEAVQVEKQWMGPLKDMLYNHIQYILYGPREKFVLLSSFL